VVQAAFCTRVNLNIPAETKVLFAPPFPQGHNFTVRKSVQIGVSMVCVAVILGGARYAWARESFRLTDLHSVYQEINRESFGGQLMDATVEWAELDNAYGETRADEDSADIKIDPRLVTSEAKLQEIMSHEACHVATVTEAEARQEDAHGKIWSECMRRFN
jgi:hypothetical protein